MIVFLTGPTGVGKTDTSWSLISLHDGMVFLDCDWFASRSQFSWDDSADVESVYRAIKSQIVFHRVEGRRNFVVTLTIEMARTFANHLADFAKLGIPIFAIRLSAAPDVIDRRIVARARVQSEQERTNAAAQQIEFDRLFPDAAIFSTIDTSDLESEDVAKRIVEKIPG